MPNLPYKNGVDLSVETPSVGWLFSFFIIIKFFVISYYNYKTWISDFTS